MRVGGREGAAAYGLVYFDSRCNLKVVVLLCEVWISSEVEWCCEYCILKLKIIELLILSPCDGHSGFADLCRLIWIVIFWYYTAASIDSVISVPLYFDRCWCLHCRSCSVHLPKLVNTIGYIICHSWYYKAKCYTQQMLRSKFRNTLQKNTLQNRFFYMWKKK